MEQNRQRMKEIRIRNKKVINWSRQLLLVLLPVLAFLTAAAISKCTKKQFSDFQGIIIFIIILDVLYVISWEIWAYWNIKLSSKRRRRKKRSLQNRMWLLFVLLYTIGIRVAQMGDIQRWDASIYYNAIRNGCSNFDFTLRSFLEGFSVASHMTWGYMGLLGIGEFLFEGSVVAVQAVNLVLTVLCVFCLYRIMERLVPGKDKKFIALAVCILSTLPVFAGTFSYCNPDMGLAIFSVLMIYCYLQKQWLLLFFCMLFTVASKETGILVVGGFTAGIFLWRFKSAEGKVSQRLRYAMEDYLCREAAVTGICVLIIGALYLLGGGRIWSMQSESKAEFSTFTVIPAFIWNNIKQFYALNFNWIATILIAVCLIKAALEKKSGTVRKITKKPEILAGISGGYLISVLFYFFYITFTLPRYHIIIDIFWNMLTLVCIGIYMDRIKLRNLILSIYCLLLVCQAYTTVDPVSEIAFIPHDTGSETILTTQHPREDLLTISTGDYNVYNHQYNYISEAVEQILREVDYQEGMDLVSYDSQEMVMEGVKWDRLHKEFTYEEGRMVIPVNVVKGADVYQVESGRKAVFIYYPQNAGNLDENMEHLRWYYDFYYRGEVKIQYGGTLYYWVGERY